MEDRVISKFSLTKVSIINQYLKGKNYVKQYAALCKS